jgi:arthrofactin-type cyclic lipopeptide synthetase C
VSEQHLLLEDWNRTEVAYPQERCIHELFEDQVRRTPDAVAVVFGDEQLSYAELNARANRLARHLRSLGVRPDARVAICVERSLEMVMGLLGVLKAGGAYVPLDPAYPAERLAYMLEDSGPVAVLTHGAARAALAEAGADRPVVDLEADAAVWAELAGDDLAREDLPQGGLNSRHLVCVIYTSGSTGQPKGVMIEHRNLVNQITALQSCYQLTCQDRVLQFARFAFDMSVEEIFGALLSGSTLVLRDDGWLQSSEDFFTHCRAHAITVANLPAAFWQSATLDPSISIPRTVRQIMIGGEAISEGSLVRWLARDGHRPRLFNAYGPTEATVNASIAEMTKISDWHHIGRPIWNTRLYVLDEYGEPVPVGVAGELYIGGAGVARGYLNRPELTAERFIESRFVAGDRLYRTGDMVRYLPDGNLEFLGRNDHQVKIRGFRIELGEIEARLVEHSGVREAVVLAREDAPGEKRLVAYVVAEAEAAEDLAGALRGHLQGRLPDYMVPAAFVRVEELPLTPNGKLDRKALPAPDEGSYARREYAAPLGVVEERLAAIWQEVLGVARVGRHDNFFELGGHSLMAVRLVSALSRNGMRISLAQLFAHPTIEGLGRLGTAEANLPLQLGVVPLRTEGRQLPLFLIPEMSGQVLPYGPLLTSHVDPDVPVYGLTNALDAEASPRTMQGMAVRLVRAIRAVQPAGPYRLVGWSFGGTLAYEIATQLIGEDETIEFLGLIDTHSRTAIELPPQDAAYLRAVVVNAVGRRQGSSTGASELDAVDPQDFVAMAQKCQELSLLPKPFDRLSVPELRDSIFRLRLRDEANNQYEASPIGVPIHLFIAREDSSDDTSRGWSAVVPDGQLSIIPVPGDHWSVMEEPHVAHLGTALSSAIRQSSRSQSVRAHDEYSPLVTIQTGRRGGAPVLCIPGAGGNAAVFASFAAALGESWPVYGLQPRGLDGLHVPHSTVPAAACAYLSALEEWVAQGPVHLLGHSFGGCVAFEMALRLRTAGREVASLTLIDSEVPADAERREYTRAEALTKLVEIWELAADRSLDVDIEQLTALDTAQRLAALHPSLVRAGLMPHRSNPEALAGMVRTFEAALRTSYRPQAVYPGHVRLLLLRDIGLDDEAQERQFADCVSAWRTWAPDLDVWHGPGNHMTALKPPHVEVLADWVRAKLQAAALRGRQTTAGGG